MPNWNLDDILPLSSFTSLYQSISSRLNELAGFRKFLQPGMAEQKFAEIIAFEEQFSRDLMRLYDMPTLRETTNRNDREARKLKSQAQTLLLEAQEQGRYLSHWIQGKEVTGLKVLDEKNAARLFRAVPAYSHLFSRARKLASYTLHEREEQIVSSKDSILGEALLDLRGLTESAQEFKFKPSGSRARKIKSQAALMKYVHDPKPEYREAAYKALYVPYKQNLDSYFLIYQAVVKDWGTTAKMRGYKSPVSVRNVSNDLHDTVVSLLLQVCRENREIFQRFFKLKAEILQVKKLSRYDLYAPYPGSPDKKISYAEAVKMVQQTFREFHPGFAAKADLIIDSGHIDSHPSPLKQPGAFCATITPEIVPYVLLNFTGTIRDVSVIAHELGHGIHSLYAADKPLEGQHPTLPMAETASTFAEMLLFDKLVNTADERLATALLFDKLSDTYATVMRQMYFAAFEQEAHNTIAAGTTAEELSETYFKLLQEQFGDSVELPEDFRYEWAYVPHFVRTPFYVYAYAFGELLAMALYEMYKQQGDNVIPVIEEILGAGCTEYPEELLKKAGIDITQKEFWQKSFTLVEEWLAKLYKSFHIKR